MLRSTQERIAQTFAYELSGLLISLPLMAVYSQKSNSANAGILTVLAVAVMAWTPLYNAAFDKIELLYSKRVASDRPQGMRIVHAVLHELIPALFTLPILIWLAGMDLRTAIIVELGLCAIYAGWAYIFYLAWDHIRPITPMPTFSNLEQTS